MLIIRSGARYALSAETSPPMNANGIIRKKAKSASLAELGSARARIELTDSPEV